MMMRGVVQRAVVERLAGEHVADEDQRGAPQTQRARLLRRMVEQAREAAPARAGAARQRPAPRRLEGGPARSLRSPRRPRSVRDAPPPADPAPAPSPPLRARPLRHAGSGRPITTPGQAGPPHPPEPSSPSRRRGRAGGVGAWKTRATGPAGPRVHGCDRRLVTGTGRRPPPPCRHGRYADGDVQVPPRPRRGPVQRRRRLDLGLPTHRPRRHAGRAPLPHPHRAGHRLAGRGGGGARPLPRMHRAVAGAGGAAAHPGGLPRLQRSGRHALARRRAGGPSAGRGCSTTRRGSTTRGRLPRARARRCTTRCAASTT